MNDNTKTREEISKAQEAYIKFCADNDYTDFTYDGICFRCKRNIFEYYDGTEYITGCPFCHYSFVE